jgi:hypothetical protein
LRSFAMLGFPRGATAPEILCSHLDGGPHPPYRDEPVPCLTLNSDRTLTEEPSAGLLCKLPSSEASDCVVIFCRSNSVAAFREFGTAMNEGQDVSVRLSEPRIHRRNHPTTGRFLYISLAKRFRLGVRA